MWVLSDLTKFNLDLDSFPMVRNSFLMIIFSIAYYKLNDVFAVKFYYSFSCSSLSICLDGEPTVENELLFDFLSYFGEGSWDSSFGGLDMVGFSFGYEYFCLNLSTSLWDVKLDSIKKSIISVNVGKPYYFPSSSIILSTMYSKFSHTILNASSFLSR